LITAATHNRWSRVNPHTLRRDTKRLLALKSCTVAASAAAADTGGCSQPPYAPRFQITNGDESCLHARNASDSAFDYRIGRVVLELAPQQDWIDRYKMMDEIWVPSTFHQRWLVDAGLDAERTVVVPEVGGRENANE
jgi:hypothetical protein